MGRRRIVLGITASVADRVAVLLTQLALVPILVGHWGTEAFGVWAMLMALPSLLILGDLGFGTAATVQATMEVARGDPDAACAILSSAAQIIAVACAVLLAIAAGCLMLPVGWLRDLTGLPLSQLRSALLMVSGYTCILLWTPLVSAGLRSTGRHAHAVALGTMTYLLENALLIAAVLAGLGLLGGVSALFAGRIVGFAATAFHAARIQPALLPSLYCGRADTLRELAGSAIASLSIPLATALLLHGTVATLGLVAGAVAVPAFVAARTLSRIGLQVTQVFTGAMMPEFGAAEARGDGAAKCRLVLILLLISAAIAVPFAIGLALAGPAIIRIWSGGEIAASPALMAIMALSALLGAMWKPQSDLMLAANRQREFAVPLVGAALAALGLTLLAAPRLGAVAPAVAIVLVDTAMCAITARFVFQTLRHRGGSAGIMPGH